MTTLVGDLVLRRRDGCAHDPDRPRLIPQKLREAGNRFARAVAERFSRIFESRLRPEFREDWPELLAREISEEGDELAPFARRRSERVEAVIVVVGVLLRHLNFRNSSVDGGADRGVGVTQIAGEAGISRRRVERALRTLRRAKIISFTEHRRRTRAEAPLWYSEPSVRKITPRFFEKLGDEIARKYSALRERLKHQKPARPKIDLRVPAHPTPPAAPSAPTGHQPTTTPALTLEALRLKAAGVPDAEIWERLRRPRE